MSKKIKKLEHIFEAYRAGVTTTEEAIEEIEQRVLSTPESEEHMAPKGWHILDMQGNDICARNCNPVEQPSPHASKWCKTNPATEEYCEKYHVEQPKPSCCCHLGNHSHVGSACTTCKHCKEWKDEWYKENKLKNFQPFIACTPPPKPSEKKLLGKDFIENAHKVKHILEEEGRIKKEPCEECDKPSDEWEKEFESKYGDKTHRMTFYTEQQYYWNKAFYNEIKNFISNLLLQSKQQTLEEVRKLLKYGTEELVADDGTHYKVFAVNTLLNILDDLKK